MQNQFIPLSVYIGAKKRRYSDSDPHIFGLIVAVADTTDDTKNRMVQFRDDDSGEVHEMRIAAFELESSIIADIEIQFPMPHFETVVIATRPVKLNRTTKAATAERNLLDFFGKFYPQHASA